MSRLQQRTAVVVPTYWTRECGKIRPGDGVYDHPIPLDEDGTLGRLLESLTMLDGELFYVVVICAVTDDSVSASAANKVREICRSVPEIDTLVVDDNLVARMRSGSTVETEDLIGLRDYARLRNVQLLAPLILGASAIVAVDDDEVVIDPGFLEKAVAGLGEMVGGKVVAGLGGYYLQNREGKILLDMPPGSEHASNIFDRKAAIMNAATEKLQSEEGEIVPTPFCFGGNMSFAPELSATVCFDPAITRGEDIDYLINARLAGQWYFMNKDLSILHLPPTGGSYQDVAYHKVVQDVLRFVYEREKLARWQEVGATNPVTPEDLDPYPGLFLRGDLERNAREVIQRIIDNTTATQRLDLGIDDSAEAFVADAGQRARRGVASYRERQQRWAELVTEVCQNGDMKAALEGSMSSDSSRVSL